MKSLIKVNIIIIALIFGFSTFMYSQNETSQKSVIDNLSKKLEQKVLLNNEQVKKVQDILNSYFNNRSESSLNSAKEEVEKILDTKQKAKYGIIKNEWWNSISSAVITK